MKKYEINSISDLSNLIQELGEPKEGTTRFFRGQANKKWEIKPSIFRESYLIENEDKIIKDALTNYPDDFLPTDTLFEKLVKLQHYGCKTRLLDLTTNALVALYFACSEKKSHRIKGELIILDIPNDQIKYFDSDTVAILTAISIQPKEFNILTSIKNTEIQRKLKRSEYIIKNYATAQDIDKMNNFIKDNVENSMSVDQNEFIKILESAADDIGNIAFLEAFNEQKEIIKLLHDIRTDKPSFRAAIEYNDFWRKGQKRCCFRDVCP